MSPAFFHTKDTLVYSSNPHQFQQGKTVPKCKKAQVLVDHHFFLCNKVMWWWWSSWGHPLKAVSLLWSTVLKEQLKPQPLTHFYNCLFGKAHFQVHFVKSEQIDPPSTSTDNSHQDFWPGKQRSAALLPRGGGAGYVRHLCQVTRVEWEDLDFGLTI